MAHDQVDLRLAALRALRNRCPCCGEGKLFKSYLKQVDACSACGEAFAGIRADDAAPWLTIIVIGHVFLPLAFLIDLNFLPTWGAIALLSGTFALLAAALLPVSKALFMAILWQTGATAEPQVLR